MIEVVDDIFDNRGRRKTKRTGGNPEPYRTLMKNLKNRTKAMDLAYNTRMTSER